VSVPVGKPSVSNMYGGDAQHAAKQQQKNEYAEYLQQQINAQNQKKVRTDNSTSHVLCLRLNLLSHGPHIWILIISTPNNYAVP